MASKLFGRNQNVGFLSVLNAILCLLLVAIQLFPGWFQINGQQVYVASFIKYCINSMQNGTDPITITTITILIMLFFMIVVSSMSLLAFAGAVLKNHNKQRVLGFWAFLFSMLCSAGVFFATFLANYFLAFNSYYLEVNIVQLSWFPYINFFVSFLCLVCLVPQLRSFKEFGLEQRAISSPAIASPLVPLTDRGKKVIGEAGEEKISRDKHAGEDQSFGRLVGYMMPYKVQLACAGLSIIVGAVCLAFAPYILGLTTDKILDIFVNGKLQPDAYQTFLNSAIFLCLVYIGYSLFEYLGQFALTYATEHTL